MSTEPFKYAEEKNGLLERWEFKIQRESREKRGGRLTKVRWCMRNWYTEWRIYQRKRRDESREREMHRAMGKRDAGGRERERGGRWEGLIDGL